MNPHDPPIADDDPTGEEPVVELDQTRTDVLDDTYRMRVAFGSEETVDRAEAPSDESPALEQAAAARRCGYVLGDFAPEGRCRLEEGHEGNHSLTLYFGASHPGVTDTLVSSSDDFGSDRDD
jgi:hypothetical protein